MKNVVIMVLGILAMNSAYAGEIEFEIGTGFNYYQEQHDGAWYQKAYPHWLDMKSTPLSIGISQKTGKNRYRVEFVYLGPMYIQAAFVPDGVYNPANTGCVGAGTCDLYVLQGRGSTSGVLLSASRDVPIWGLPFYAEAGLFANVHKWKVSVMKPDGTLLAEVEREYQITYGPTLGFGIRYSGVDVGIRYYYLDDSSEDDPITPAHIGAIAIEYKIYF